MFGWGKKEKKSDFVIEEDDNGGLFFYDFKIYISTDGMTIVSLLFSL